MIITNIDDRNINIDIYIIMFEKNVKNLIFLYFVFQTQTSNAD